MGVFDVPTVYSSLLAALRGAAGLRKGKK